MPDVTVTVKLETITCCKCGLPFAAPDYYWSKRQEDGQPFHCPNGHPQVFGEPISKEMERRVTVGDESRRVPFRLELEERCPKCGATLLTDGKSLVRLRLKNMGRMAPSLAGLDLDEVAPERAGGAPTIVCLCGSTRFGAAFRCDMCSDAELFADKSEAELAEIKERLDELHLRKIDLSDEVLILNVGGYIGQSTSRELAYARRLGKRVRFLEPHED